VCSASVGRNIHLDMWASPPLFLFSASQPWPPSLPQRHLHAQHALTSPTIECFSAPPLALANTQPTPPTHLNAMAQSFH